MATIHNSKDPLKDAVAKVTRANIEKMSHLRVAKFGNIGVPFIGFEGEKGNNDKYYQLRVDWDPTKKGHVNVMINGSEKHEYVGENLSEDWFMQVVNNINGGQYCGTDRDDQNKWKTEGQTTNPQHIEGMKKFMRRYL